MNAQLIDAETGAHLWADQFDTTRANLAEAQSEITGRLAWTLNIELLSDASRRIEHENAVDPDARDLVMRGWAFVVRAAIPKDRDKRPCGRSSAHWRSTRALRMRGSELHGFSLES